MYAIIETGGLQFKVETGMKLNIPKIPGEVGEQIVIDRVLLTDDGKDSVVGTPFVKDATVGATILEHGRDKKIIVFKRKRRKGMEKKQGHRQDYTRVEIGEILVGSVKTPAAETADEKPVAEKADTKKSAPKKTEAKEADTKKSAAKKTEAKKTDTDKAVSKKTDAKKTVVKKTTKKADKEKTDTE